MTPTQLQSLLYGTPPPRRAPRDEVTPATLQARGLTQKDGDE